ncbi:MAG: MFS transporter, partial [Dehalococcoidia bacterium]
MKRIPHGWRVVGGSFVLLFCATGTHFYAFPIFLDAMVRDMQWTRAQIAFAMTLASIVVAIASLLIGILLRKLGLRAVMVGGSITAGVGFLLLSGVSELWRFYLYYGLVLSAGMAGIYEVPNLTAVGSWFDRGRSTALGIATTGMGLGGVVMAPLAGWLISRYGWQTTFAFMAAIVMALGIPVGAFVMKMPKTGLTPLTPAKKEHAEYGGTTLVQALRGRPFWLIALSATLWYGAFAMGLTHQVAFAVDLQIPALVAAGAVGALSAFSIPGRLGFGRLGDMIDKRYVLMLAAAMQLTAFIIILLADRPLMIYLYSCLLGFGIGGLTPILPGLIADYFGRNHFSAIYGTLYMVTTLGFMIGPVYGGWTYDATGSYHT